ncbi:DNA-directed RNA polymerase V subunit 7-like [Ziziphus jujuba]|nr:DNA-directed RNA polymerase V subunit 7-like [Ziziphus jujuba]XP_048332683.1 DNA-directed RNA polymerase V subunit 7-like [Ziziphus jujuba]
MYFEVELVRDVAVLAENFKKDVPISQGSIITQLLENLLQEKATKDHGYFLSVTSLKRIGKGEVVEESGNVLFPVVFNCRTFLPIKGEILHGVVHHTLRLGVCLRCGPIKYAFLSARKMPRYQFVSGEKPVFLSDELGKIEAGVVVRFVVLDLRWIEKRGRFRKEFVMLASLEGDSLGPIALSGSDELGL